MKKLITFAFLFVLSACSSAPQTQHPVTVSEPQIQQPAAVSEPTQKLTHPPEIQTSIMIYDPQTANYINNNPAVLKLKKIAPEFAQKTLGAHCTVEKLVAGLNAGEVIIEKTAPEILSVKTLGTKRGEGMLTVKAQENNTAQIISAKIGNLNQSNTIFLTNMAERICTSVDEKH